MELFPLKLRLRIDWSEIDLFGHVNNVATLKYVQAARVNCLEALGLMQAKLPVSEDLQQRIEKLQPDRSRRKAAAATDSGISACQTG